MARQYRKRRRAELEEATRRKIVRALVALHGTVGPARTTIQAVAEKAGVQRATVYRHFPDEPAMFAACSAHWAEQNPLPDPAAWAGVAKRRRTAVALGELYAFYGRNEAMLANVLRDESLVEAMRPAVEALHGYMAAAADQLAGPAATPLARAAIAHAIAFGTWRSLVRDNGLSPEQAVALMEAMVRRASRG